MLAYSIIHLRLTDGEEMMVSSHNILGGKKMTPISTDVRTRIVEVYREGQLSYPTVAERFRVRANSVKNFVTQWRATGTLEPNPIANSTPCMIDAAGEDVL
ncbi:transposase and inactivated derivatives [Candidatus Vecturithrix granuli]|uniref:Transposase and inactivated derivatives n=1 Tax=Vecturithrix granuli TaxID=1499967 RepID=A0A081C7L1_VECG1|nr:transposase and inactivated derivatives [Candidatus Vecturithrix granuli]